MNKSPNNNGLRVVRLTNTCSNAAKTTKTLGYVGIILTILVFILSFALLIYVLMQNKKDPANAGEESNESKVVLGLSITNIIFLIVLGVISTIHIAASNKLFKCIDTTDKTT